MENKKVIKFKNFNVEKKASPMEDFQKGIDSERFVLDFMESLIEPIEKDAREAAELVSLDFSKFKMPDYSFNIIQDLIHNGADIIFPFEWTSRKGTKYEIGVMIDNIDVEKGELSTAIYLKKTSENGNIEGYDFTSKCWVENEEFENVPIIGTPEWDLEESAIDFNISEQEYNSARKNAEPLMQLLGKMQNFMTAGIFVDKENLFRVHLIPYDEDIFGFHIVWDGSKYVLEQHQEGVYSHPVMKVDKNNIEKLFPIVRAMADRCYRYDMAVIPLSADSYIEVQDGKTIEEANIISLSGKKELNKMENINLEVSAENCIFVSE